MNELAKIAAASVGLSTCLKIEKLPEGNFNKTYLMTMRDGAQVVAKVRNPNAGYPHLVTASEVATMRYARDILRLPVPRVHAWNSRSATNSVGAEYIIMDKVAGIELSQRWPKMRSDQKLRLVDAIADMERKFVSSPFPAIGSLYYEKDLNDLPNQSREHRSVSLGLDQETFVIGPTTARNSYDYSRWEVEFDKGPFDTIPDFLTSLGTREERCIEKLGVSPEHLGLFGGPGSYKPTVASKLAVLRDYNKVAKYLLPDNTSSHLCVLWHGDLHMDNVFVNPDDPTQITGLIDWQATCIAPLFLQASWPHFLDFEGPKHKEMTPPRLPSNFGQLSPSEQKDAKNPPVYDALRFQETLKAQIIAYAQSLLVGGGPRLKGKLIMLEDNWGKLVGKDGPPCPLQYSERERQVQQNENELWMQGYMNMLEVLRAIGDAQVGWDGWVTHEQYEPVKEKVREVRKAFLAQISEKEEEREEWAKIWPFGTEEELR
ncbi:MAG: hypothetical protein Q9211_004893 [Gyalolechia sp. 1 TL-2023]